MKSITPENFLQLLKSYLPHNPIIIEAGAFNGNDTKKLSLSFPAGLIHAFEPVPEIFAELENQTLNLTNVRLYQIALSDKTGFTSFYMAEHPKNRVKFVRQEHS